MRETAYHPGILKYLIPSLLAALLLFVFLPPSPAIAAPVLQLSPAAGPVGIPVTVSGSVFDSYKGDIIHIIFDTAELESSPIVIPSTGIFNFSARVPANAVHGQHIFGVKRNMTDSSFIASAIFTVEQRLLNPDIPEGPGGTEIYLTGSGFYPGEAVSLKYTNPAAADIGTATASSAGKFGLAYVIPTGVAGNHKFTASNIYGNTAETVFKVLPDITLNVSSSPPKSVLTIKGTGFSYRSIVSITLGTQIIANAAANDFGGFEAQFAVPDIAPGKYYLKAQDAYGLKDETELIVSAGTDISATAGSVGSPVTITGRGFGAGKTIDVYYDEKKIATTAADNNGDFSITFNIPPGSGGGHIISVGDDVTTRQYTYTIETIPPYAPLLSIPAHNSITGAYTYFQWQAVMDTSMPVAYELEISSDSNFTNIVLKKSGIAGAQYTLADNERLAADSIDSLFFWRLMAIDAAGNRGAWSETRAFYVDVPKTPGISLPAIGETVEFPVRLGWVAVTSLSEPVVYNLQVSRNIEFTELLFDEKSLSSNDFVIGEDSKNLFKKKTPYYWRVKAIDNAQNTSGWSAVGSFNIASSGFPTWATITLIVIAGILGALLAFRLGRRSAYH